MRYIMFLCFLRLLPCPLIVLAVQFLQQLKFLLGRLFQVGSQPHLGVVVCEFSSPLLKVALDRCIFTI